MDELLQELRQLIAQASQQGSLNPEDQQIVNYYNELFNAIDTDPHIAHFFSNSFHESEPQEMGTQTDERFMDPNFSRGYSDAQSLIKQQQNQPQSPQSVGTQADERMFNPNFAQGYGDAQNLIAQRRANPSDVSMLSGQRKSVKFANPLESLAGNANYDYLPKSKSFSALKGL